MESLGTPNNHSLNKYLKNRKRSVESNENESKKKPTVLNLFPYIGMINNDNVFTTCKKS